MNISELQPGAGFEIKAEIIAQYPERRLWKCFKCQKQGIWKNPDDFLDFCPECNEVPSTEKGKGVWFQRVCSFKVKDESGECYLDLWNEDIDNFTDGDKIHLVNGYCTKNDKGYVYISKGKFGALLKI